MNIAPLDIGRFPRVGAAEAATTRAVARALGLLPTRAALAVPPFGSVSLVYAGLAEGAASAEQVALGLVRDGHAGRLLLDVAFGHALISGALGQVGAVPVLRRLSVSERGLLAGVVAAVLERLGVVASLTLSQAAPLSRCLRLAIDARLGDLAGRLVLEAPPAWLRQLAGAPVDRARAARLAVTLSVQVAITDLRAKEITALAVGDAVVFDGTPAPAGGFATPWPVRVALGGSAASGSLGADGKLTIDGGFEPTPDSGGAGTGKESVMEGSGTSLDAGAVLAEAPVEVVAELGRITLRGDEVLGLAPGTVVAFPGGVPQAPPTVRLRVAGEIWAEGELVDVDGELGVRVTALRRA